MKWAIRERKAMMVMAAGAIFYAGWVSSAAHFNISGKWADQRKLVVAETTVIPQLKTQIRQKDCDRYKMATVAVQGIVAAKSSSPTDAPDWDDLKPCPKVAPVKPPPVSAIVTK